MVFRQHDLENCYSSAANCRGGGCNSKGGSTFFEKFINREGVNKWKQVDFCENP